VFRGRGEKKKTRFRRRAGNLAAAETCRSTSRPVDYAGKKQVNLPSPFPFLLCLSRSPFLPVTVGSLGGLLLLRAKVRQSALNANSARQCVNLLGQQACAHARITDSSRCDRVAHEEGVAGERITNEHKDCLREGIIAPLCVTSLPDKVIMADVKSTCDENKRGAAFVVFEEMRTSERNTDCTRRLQDRKD